MSFITRHLKEDVTHWPVTGSDGFGGFLYGAPVLLKGRWEEKAALFLANDTEEQVSKAIVYLAEGVDNGDYRGFGDYTDPAIADPSSLSSAHRVKQRHRTTDLRAMSELWKVFL